jgi:hypothetical protein
MMKERFLFQKMSPREEKLAVRMRENYYSEVKAAALQMIVFTWKWLMIRGQKRKMRRL